MSNAGETQEQPELITDREVCEYLSQHPDFFIRNARLVEQMRIPHPVRGTVSLVEWHMARQRVQISQMEEDIGLLLEQARENEGLFYSLLRLQSLLVAASSLQDMLNRLHRWARDLGLAGANVRLFPDRWRIGAPSDFTHLGLSHQNFEPLRIQRFGDEQHYLGPLHGPELLTMLPQGKAIGSVAMSLLGRDGNDGVLIFSSRDPQHYQAGQGTQFLREVALMLPGLIERWIERV
ncbi:DUF484 domain-containing protein [Shimwellia pseudoproteus]|uniref:DUF484 domain-containing protein n=1 Tax=Shimwellia pseudoproteus TaxID=570012 RepID=UPI0018ED141A|nr:DUF484 domain-containing protein [Shimwellia pseudoproteus]MBJ3815935.1 DUF484 domain-containing protein [Shimwellia pseudoproteus]